MKSSIKFFLKLVLILISYNAISQELALEHDINLKPSFDKEVVVYPVFSKDSSMISLCMLDKKYIYGILLDKDFNLEKRIIRNIPKINHDILLGGIFSDNLYTLIFTDYEKTNFSSISFDYENSTIRNDNINLNLTHEIFLESFCSGNKLFILSVENNSILNLYEFNSFYNLKTNKYDIANSSFIDSKSLLQTLRQNQNSTQTDNLIQKIDNRVPNSLELARYLNKLYYNNDQIVLTFDKNRFYTSLITIDLLDYKIDFKNIHHNNPSCSKSNVSSNSFYFEDYLFIIDVCFEQLKFSIHNLNSNKTIKSRSVNKSEEINFKNTRLIKEGSAYVTNSYFINNLLELEGETEIDNTHEFLRKINNSQVGIACYPFKDNFEITIGGYIKSQTVDLQTYPSSFQYTNGEVLYTPGLASHHSFNSYDYSRITYFKSVFSMDSLNHIKNIRIYNVFDRIKQFTTENKNIEQAKTVFKINDYNFLGYWNKNTGKYYLYKFQD